MDAARRPERGGFVASGSHVGGPGCFWFGEGGKLLCDIRARLPVDSWDGQRFFGYPFLSLPNGGAPRGKRVPAGGARFDGGSRDRRGVVGALVLWTRRAAEPWPERGGFATSRVTCMSYGWPGVFRFGEGGKLLCDIRARLPVDLGWPALRRWASVVPCPTLLPTWEKISRKRWHGK